ncbi:unnamed protein product [Linum trigynum]|uniref:Uncharacterized protein n=1 Tax=Linum trigynum TaxID=586398 RepID=A0AAV2GH58_9ROSI
MKSTSGFTFTLGSVVFCWSSKKQSVVAQSTAEAEYIVGSEAVNHAVWLRKIVEDLSFKQMQPTVINCDNQSAVAMAKNPVFYGRTKHIKIKYHVLRKAEAEGLVSLVHYSTQVQFADIFTKSLPKTIFEELKKIIGMVSDIGKEECCGSNLDGTSSSYLCHAAEEMKPAESRKVLKHTQVQRRCEMGTHAFAL